MSLYSIGRSILLNHSIAYKLKYTKYILTRWKLNKWDADDKIEKQYIGDGLMNEFKLVGSNSEENVVPELPVFPTLNYQEFMPTFNQLNVSQEIYILHMLAHIEFSAINIYWDTLIRPFNKLVDREIINNIIKSECELKNIDYNNRLIEVENILDNMKLYYNSHFLSILNDEIHHFEMLNNRLIQLGTEYGKLPVTNKLLTHCIETKSDFLSRVIMTNLVSEAKGLDAGPKLIREISNDEEKHVAVGMYILNDIAKKLDIDPEKIFQSTVKKYMPIGISGGFNLDSRDRANMPQSFYKPLEVKITHGPGAFTPKKVVEVKEKKVFDKTKVTMRLFSTFESFVQSPYSKATPKTIPRLNPLTSLFPKANDRVPVLLISASSGFYTESFSSRARQMTWEGSRYFQRWRKLPDFLSEVISKCRKIEGKTNSDPPFTFAALDCPENPSNFSRNIKIKLSQVNSILKSQNPSVIVYENDQLERECNITKSNEAIKIIDISTSLSKFISKVKQTALNKLNSSAHIFNDDFLPNDFLKFVTSDSQLSSQLSKFMISCHNVDILLCSSSYEKLILTKYLSIPSNKVSIISFLFPESEQHFKRLPMYSRKDFAIIVNPNSTEDKLGVINFCKNTWPLISSYLPGVKLDIHFISNEYIPYTDASEWNNSFTVLEKQLSSYKNVVCRNQTTFSLGPLWLRSKLYDYRAVLCPWNVSNEDNALTSNINSSSSISLIESLLSGTPFVAYSYSMLGLPNFASKIHGANNKTKLTSYGGYSKDFGGVIVPSIPDGAKSWDDIKVESDKNFSNAAVDLYHLASLTKWKDISGYGPGVALQNYEFTRRLPIFQRVIENLDNPLSKTEKDDNKLDDYSPISVSESDTASKVAKFHEERTLEFIRKIDLEKENEIKIL